MCLTVAAVLISVIVISAPFSHDESLCAANIAFTTWNSLLLAAVRISYIFECPARENFVAMLFLSDLVNAAVGMIALCLYAGEPSTPLFITNVICFSVCAFAIALFQLWYCANEARDCGMSLREIGYTLCDNLKNYWQCCFNRNRVQNIQPVVIKCCS